jgi:hypothetical protein
MPAAIPAGVGSGRASVTLRRYCGAGVWVDSLPQVGQVVLPPGTA